MNRKTKTHNRVRVDDAKTDALADVLWSVLFKTEPLSSRRKKAVILVMLAMLLASGLYEFWSSQRAQSAAQSAQQSIHQEGGVHIGDNVIGQQFVIEVPAGQPKK
jgi:hypothetical protein